MALLATHRHIEPVHVSKVTADRQIRKVLDQVIRLHSRLVEPTYHTAMALTGVARVHRDHIVPVRALVDRMIMNPSDCAGVLDAVELAEVTNAEHRRLGGLWSDHAETCALLLSAPVGDLVDIGLQRYATAGIELHRRAT